MEKNYKTLRQIGRPALYYICIFTPLAIHAILVTISIDFSNHILLTCANFDLAIFGIKYYETLPLRDSLIETTERVTLDRDFVLLQGLRIENIIIGPLLTCRFHRRYNREY